MRHLSSRQGIINEKNILLIILESSVNNQKESKLSSNWSFIPYLLYLYSLTHSLLISRSDTTLYMTEEENKIKNHIFDRIFY